MITMLSQKWYLPRERDQFIYHEIYELDRYGLRGVDLRSKVVLDVGANIGTYARLAAEQGAMVIAFEPDPENIEILARNVETLPVIIVKGAITEKGGPCTLYGNGDPLGFNTFHGHNPREIESEGFARAVDYACQTPNFYGKRAGRVAICKFNAEGVECPIVLNCPEPFKLIDRLDIEFHGGYGDGLRDTITCRKKLEEYGFREVKWEIVSQDMGWFRLYRGIREGCENLLPMVRT